MVRITYKNIRHGIKSVASNDAFTECVMEKIISDKTLSLEEIINVIKESTAVPFSIEQIDMIRKEIKIDALCDDLIFETPDGEIH